MKTYLRTTKNLYSDIVNGYQVFTATIQLLE